MDQTFQLSPEKVNHHQLSGIKIALRIHSEIIILEFLLNTAESVIFIELRKRIILWAMIAIGLILGLPGFIGGVLKHSPVQSYKIVKPDFVLLEYQRRVHED